MAKILRGAAAIHLKLLACKVLQRELSYLSAKCQNNIDITYIRQGFHNEPAKLRGILQGEIDAIDAGTDVHSGNDRPFDAILIGYGLCSNGVAGLSSKKFPLVIPKAHDCTTLLLGSREKYDRFFKQNSGGIYWYSPGWIENAPMPGRERYEAQYREYVEKYGEDNADYLMEMEQGWMTEYSRLIYIDWDALSFPRHIAFARECAEYLNWHMDVVKGDPALLLDFLEGRWGDDFVVVPPGGRLEASNDENVLRAAKGDHAPDTAE